jgi:hypothetical protein
MKNLLVTAMMSCPEQDHGQCSIESADQEPFLAVRLDGMGRICGADAGPGAGNSSIVKLHARPDLALIEVGLFGT